MTKQMTFLRTTLNLTYEDKAIIEGLAKTLDLNNTSVIRRAIRLEKMIQDAHAQGATIVFQERDGSVSELIFP